MPLTRRVDGAAAAQALLDWINGIVQGQAPLMIDAGFALMARGGT